MRSLFLRSVLAIVLMIGFYLLAAAMVAGLVWIPYADYVYLRRIDSRIAIFCLITAAAIVSAAWPRRDRFQAPGPELTAEDQPELFAEIEQLASATAQRMPEHVYAVADMNAFVAQRGGVMGFGSKRVMGIGLPLMRTLNISQFRAVVAHEFGHYYGGDTSLGPWIYKTRSAMLRTVGSLVDEDGEVRWIGKPFHWYGQMFMAVTQAISRNQERSADDLASRTVGARYLMDGLKKIHGGAAVLNAFWQSELQPVIAAGYFVPYTSGFGMFAERDGVRKVAENVVAQELRDGKGEKYDSHPPLRERVERLQKVRSEGEAERTEPAMTLVRNTESVEAALLQQIAASAGRTSLKRIGWEDATEKVHIPTWRAVVKAHPEIVRDKTVEDMPAFAAQSPAFAPEKFFDTQVNAARKQNYIVGCALALLLIGIGAETNLLPGVCEFKKNGVVVNPFTFLRELSDGSISGEEWSHRCEALGIAGKKLLSDAAAAVA